MGISQRREREKQQRSKDILDAARSLFWINGYDGTTIPAIAKAAELAPGTLYLYFANKDSLYVELLLEGYEALREKLIAAAGSHSSPADQAEAVIDGFFDFAKQSPEYFDIIFFVIQKDRDGGWGETFDQGQLVQLEARLDSCKAIAANVLRKLDIRATTQEINRSVDAVWTMLAGVVFFFRRKEEADVFAVMAAEAKKLILRGLLQ